MRIIIKLHDILRIPWCYRGICPNAWHYHGTWPKNMKISWYFDELYGNARVLYSNTMLC